MKNQKGFTLVEMLIVMLIISALLLLVVPNIVKRSEGVSKKGCDAFKSMVVSQVQAYKLDKGSYPDTMTTLKTAKYITEVTCCPEHTYTIEEGEVSRDPE